MGHKQVPESVDAEPEIVQTIVEQGLEAEARGERYFVLIFGRRGRCESAG